jgi:hypothetical protein
MYFLCVKMDRAPFKKVAGGGDSLAAACCIAVLLYCWKVMKVSTLHRDEEGRTDETSRRDRYVDGNTGEVTEGDEDTLR